ncbi:MAG: arsenate reductase (glutaredoxin) [Rhodospirillaceae bacterium]|nr:MAG: arsenate reductase (glutaredoxin) [Rhodospirillaceae bacterium]
MALTIYHNPRCSTSRKTLALLQEQGLKPRIVQYLDTPLKADEIKVLLKKLKLTAHELLRRKEAPALGLDPATMSETQLIAAMAKHPILIERPVVVNGAKAALGRPPESVLSIL